MPLKSYSFSVIGSREMNQDSLLADEEKGLFAVADGVGGGLRGEIASSMAVEGLKLYASPMGSLAPAIQKLQEDILKEAMESLGDALMGTTLTAVRVRGTEATLGHIGDSRLYLFTESHLKLLTEDHESFDEGMGGPVLSSYLGMPSDIHPMRIQNEVFAVTPGDRLLLCSDGLYRQMTETRISQLIQVHFRQPQEMLAAMCAEASASEFSDNVTIVYVEID